MGVYVSVRGWLECEETQLAAVQEIISAHDDGFYTRGWSLPREPFNWTCYVFYGGDIRQQAVDWLLGQLGSIARLPASDPDNDLVRGLFFASHEADGMSEWRIHQGQVLISSGDKRYRYLDD